MESDEDYQIGGCGCFCIAALIFVVILCIYKDHEKRMINGTSRIHKENY